MNGTFSATIYLAMAAQVFLVSQIGGVVARGQAGGDTVAKGKRIVEAQPPKHGSAAPIDDPQVQTSNQSLELRIVNSTTGRPVPGVSIRILAGGNFPGKTDEAGRFTISRAARSSSFLVLDIQKPGFVPLQVSWDNSGSPVPVELPRTFTLKLEPGSTIGGMVQDEQGRPIAVADVRVSVPSSGRAKAGEPRIRVHLDYRGKTDKSGHWRCDEVPAQLDSVMLSISHPDFADEGRRRNVSPFIRAARQLTELRGRTYVTTLKEGVTVRGRVRDNDGKAIEGARVTLANSSTGRSTTTDAEGRFELAHLAAGRTSS